MKVNPLIRLENVPVQTGTIAACFNHLSTFDVSIIEACVKKGRKETVLNQIIIGENEFIQEYCRDRNAKCPHCGGIRNNLFLSPTDEPTVYERGGGTPRLSLQSPHRIQDSQDGDTHIGKDGEPHGSHSDNS